MSESNKTAVIIGAGPAGLTAAYELVRRSAITPVVLEETNDIGGISKTVNYKGNRIDIGGHRFFSKSEWVMDWWQRLFPLQGAPSRDDIILERKMPLSSEVGAPDPEKEDCVMLLRNRLSRIFFLRKFFDYPVSLSWGTIVNLGFVRLARAGTSYILSRLFPKRDETYLENFFINRFGRELYRTFFEDYTEKVWGVHPSRIKADWGAQRVKGLSILTVVLHAIKTMLPKSKRGGIAQKETETSLIEQFLYPKLGPGQMWEHVADKVVEGKGVVRKNSKVVGLVHEGGRITRVTVEDQQTGQRDDIEQPDYVFSTMPIKDLIASFASGVPQSVRDVAGGLVYRDFLTVGLLLRKLKIKNETNIKTVRNIVPDNWIYVQERDVKVGRLQIFNNWSPYMVADMNHVWMGLEYFCTEGDEIWSKSPEEMKEFAIRELARIDIIEAEDVIDAVVVKVPKAYPAYFGTYDDLAKVIAFTDTIENLYLIGRNGQHRYNNADHSMLCAKEAVDNVVLGRTDKTNIWSVNTEQEYHETAKNETSLMKGGVDIRSPSLQEGGGTLEGMS